MGRALVDHLWQSTLFGAAVWSVALLLRTNSAAIRHWLWLLASFKFLVPFSALYSLGAVTVISISPEIRPSAVAATLHTLKPILSPATVDLAPASAPSSLVSTLFIVWLFGALGLGLRWLGGWRAAHMIFRAARRAPGASPDTYVIDADIEPSVARVVHPVVLLPAALLGRLPASQLEAVLAHEREHIERHDILKAQLQRLVETLFWFHPLVWIIGRRLLDERERACDEAVLARGHDPGEYAAGILAVCRHCAAARSRHAVGALAGDLAQRVRQILKSHAPLSLGFAKAFGLTACTLILTGAPLVAGALDEATHRREVAANNALLLRDAAVAVSPATSNTEGPRLKVVGDDVIVRNSSLRELLALAYGVHVSDVKGRGDWLDWPRYDLRASVPSGVREPEDFDPSALRPMVNKLLAAHFDLEVHVDQQCQDPCGPRALAAADGAQAGR
jgi:beta-lactamase regulating signal transducer with metallopeptidase domain